MWLPSDELSASSPSERRPIRLPCPQADRSGTRLENCLQTASHNRHALAGTVSGALSSCSSAKFENDPNEVAKSTILQKIVLVFYFENIARIFVVQKKNDFKFSP